MKTVIAVLMIIMGTLTCCSDGIRTQSIGVSLNGRLITDK